MSIFPFIYLLGLGKAEVQMEMDALIPLIVDHELAEQGLLTTPQNPARGLRSD
jgi:hypothetical protein